MATTPKIRNDLIPLYSGAVRVTPYDKNFKLMFDKSYTTPRPFLTSTQYTTTRTSETLPNGNGSDKDFPTDERYNLALTTQTFDPKFNAIIAGNEVITNPIPSLYDTTVTPNDAGSFVFTENEPVASPEDGKIHFEIRDSFGNALTETTEESVTADTFKYDPDTKTLTFDSSVANTSLSCVYYVKRENTQAYQAHTVLGNTVFMVETFGEMRSASTEEVIYVYQKMPRATVSGDLPNITTQKSISAAITYNFQSAPVPQGTSAFIQEFSMN